METNDDLTYSERVILRLLARDLTVREIGSELSLPVRTVRTHVQSIYRKLRVSSPCRGPERGTRRDTSGRPWAWCWRVAR